LLGDKLTHEILTDWRTAPIGEKLRAALGFIVKLTDEPAQVGAYDIASLRRLGVTERAIIDATYICVGFNIINRIADAMDFKLPPAGVFSRGAWSMRRFGYRMMSGTWPSNNVLSPSAPATMDPHERMKRLQDAVFSGRGTLDSARRQAAGAGAQISGALGLYVRKVRQRDYKEIDKCIADLQSEGFSDDQIFEATVSAAVGAGIWRLQLVVNTLRESLGSQAA
jgi:alkylhydroperoxidase family enzyme